MSSFTRTGRYKDNNQPNSWHLLLKSCAKQHYATQMVHQKSKEGPRANIMCKWHKTHLRRSSKHTDMPWPKIYTAAMTLLYFTLCIAGCSKNKPHKNHKTLQMSMISSSSQTLVLELHVQGVAVLRFAKICKTCSLFIFLGRLLIKKMIS